MESIEQIKNSINQIHDRFDRVESFISEYTKPFLDVKSASKYLNLPVTTIYHLVSKKKLPNYKIGKRLYFKKIDLDDFILDSNSKRKSIKEIEQTATDYALSKGK